MIFVFVRTKSNITWVIGCPPKGEGKGGMSQIIKCF